MNLLVGIPLLLAFETLNLSELVIVRQSSKKNGKGGLMFNSLISFFSFLFFLIYDIVTDRSGLNFPNLIWIYGIISGCLYAGGFYFMFKALEVGSFALTQMMVSFAIVIPMIYGICTGSKVTLSVILGIILIFSSIIITCLDNLQKNKKDSDSPATDKEKTSTKNLFSVKWFTFALITALCNGFITVLSKMQQTQFNNQVNNEFLAISLFVSFTILLTLSLMRGLKENKRIFKNTILYSVGAGAFNGAKNLINVITLFYVDILLLSPLKAGISRVFGFLVSVLLFKERFTKKQLIAMIIGLTATIITAINF